VTPQSSTNKPQTIPSLAQVLAGTQTGSTVVVVVDVVVLVVGSAVVLVVVDVVVLVVGGVVVLVVVDVVVLVVGDLVVLVVVDVVVLVVVDVVVLVVVVVGHGSQTRVMPHSSSNEPQRPSHVCPETQWQTPAGESLQVSGASHDPQNVSTPQSFVNVPQLKPID